MADIKSPTERYKAIADAIRKKNGTTELMHPADMPQAILDIVGGGDVIIGADYTNIVYNEDDTITLTDKDGVEHTMECEYTDGKLTSVKYDGKKVNLTYDGDVLVKVGKTAVDMANAQTSEIELLDHTVTFMVDGEPYEVVSVKDGNSVNVPNETPTSDEGTFLNWLLNGTAVSFPFVPQENTEFIGNFGSALQPLYAHTGINPIDYGDAFIRFISSGTTVSILFMALKTGTSYSDGFIRSSEAYYRSYETYENVTNVPTNIKEIVDFLIENNCANTTSWTGYSCTSATNPGDIWYTNTNLSANGTWIKVT